MLELDGNTGVSLLQDNTVTSAKIVDGAVTAGKLATAAAGAAAPQRMMLMAAKSASGTAVDFSPTDNTGVPSWAKRITVMLYDVSTNGTSLALVRVGTSSGVIAAGYASYDMRTGNSGIGSGLSTVGVALPSAGLAAYSRLGKVVFERFSPTAWIISGAIVHGQSATPDGMFLSGVVTAGDIDRIRLTTVNGTDTFDAGSVSLLIEG